MPKATRLSKPIRRRSRGSVLFSAIFAMTHLLFDFDPFGHLEFAEPVRVLSAYSLADVRPVLRAADEWSRAGGWAAGFVTYEAAPAFDPALRVQAPTRGPLAWFGLFDRPAPPSKTDRTGGRIVDLSPELSRRQYAQSMRAVRAALGRGDAYQINLTFRMHGRFEGPVTALYQRLRTAQAGHTSALLRLGRRAVLSVSPELFFARKGDRITVRPMKGTARRGRFAEEDATAASFLATSAKARAENVMIVDLMRNDLGRVARTGSVNASDLFTLERYLTIWQMTSTVSACLAPRARLDEIFAALFPCGSVTGAPKASAMAHIAALEASPRGVYCGAIGVLAPGGDARFSVAIRTLDLDLRDRTACYGTGGGITWESSAAGEWDEALAKALVLTAPEPGFDLLETMRVQQGICPRLDGHMARLGASAVHFGYAFNPSTARAAVARLARRSGDARIRLHASADGSLDLSVSPLPAPSVEPLPIALARSPVAREDRFLFHKTTCRDVYETRRRERSDVFDLLLQNEQRELTEFTIGNLVAEISGERLTPTRESGLLAGVFRDELLRRGQIRERTLHLGDLRRASRLWLINAVREWVSVRLVR